MGGPRDFFLFPCRRAHTRSSTNETKETNPGTVFMKKLNVPAAPRRAVPPPYRPAPREHFIFVFFTDLVHWSTGPPVHRSKYNYTVQLYSTVYTLLYIQYCRRFFGRFSKQIKHSRGLTIVAIPAA